MSMWDRQPAIFIISYRYIRFLDNYEQKGALTPFCAQLSIFVTTYFILSYFFLLDKDESKRLLHFNNTCLNV